jgi:hypothetical protein
MAFGLLFKPHTKVWGEFIIICPIPHSFGCCISGHLLRRSHQWKLYVINGCPCGNIARFINHSCGPNYVVFAIAGEHRDGEVYDFAFQRGAPGTSRNRGRKSRSTKRL